MKNLLLVGSVALFLMMSGCSQKTTEVEDGKGNGAVTADSNIDNVAGVGQNGEGFLDMDQKSALIKELEGKLQSVYFAFDKFDIQSSEKAKIDGNAKLVTDEKAKALTVKIEGNCDEWGTDEYNYALGLKRAASTRDALISQGVDKERMLLVSYGESKPVCSEKNAACWSKNRRADFKLLP